MPPKAKKAQVAKAKQKLEDKTFGLKNKKGGKNQKFIQTEQKAAGMDKGAQARAEARRIEERKRKIEEEKLFNRQQELLAEKIRKAKAAAALKSGNIPKPEPVPEAEDAEAPMTVSGPSLALSVGPTAMTAEQIAKMNAKNAPKKEKVVEVIVTLEELVERERAALHKKGKLTPVTFETLTKWKAKIAKEGEAKKTQAQKKVKQRVTGREYFSQNPSMASRDADDEDDAEIDASVEVRDKRITEEDKDTLEFNEDGTVQKLAELSIDSAPAPSGGGN